MNAPHILAKLKVAGVRVSRRGDNLLAEPKAAVTEPLLVLMRAHKGELLAALTDQPQNVPTAASTIATDEPGDLGAGVVTPEAEARRERVLAMLAERPGIKYAVVVDNPNADPVIVALGIRGQATCELRIPREKYDGVLLLDLIERHGGTVH